MKFCDERIQKHLLDGGKIKRRDTEIIVSLNKDKRLSCECSKFYILTQYDLIYDDWEIVETKYNWDKIIDDKILCVFSYYEDFRTFNISTLVYVDYKNDTYKTNENMIYNYCKPFNYKEFNVAEYLKDYEK